MLAVNISKLVLTQASDLTKGASSIHDGQDSGGANSSDDHASKAKVDFASVSAFVIPAHGKIAMLLNNEWIFFGR